MKSVLFLSLLIISSVWVAESRTQVLQDGIPLSQQQITGYDSKYYKYQVKDVTKDLTISVTRFSDQGDPDLFVSSVEQHPDINFNQWFSNRWGSDAVSIPHNDLQIDNWIYIAVTCFDSCIFSILAHSVAEVQLYDGEPLAYCLDQQGDTQIYKLSVGDNVKNITFNVIQNFGTVYALVKPQSLDSEYYIMMNETFGGEIYGYIGENEEGFCKNCDYYIQIDPLQDASCFILTVTTSVGVKVLQESNPVNAQVKQNQYNYFKFYMQSQTDFLNVSLTVFSGDPDIYISSGQFVEQFGMPSISNYQFSQNKIGNKTVKISKTDRQQAGQLIGWYFISVFGFVDSEYTIVVTCSVNSTIKLVSGVPSSGFVSYNQVQLYILELPQQYSGPVHFMLTPETGDPDLFVKPCEDECVFTIQEIQSPWNNPEVYYSQHFSGEDSVVVQHEKMAQKSRYVAGVLGASEQGSFYQIVAKLNDTTEEILREGQNVQDYVEKHQYKYYRFSVSNANIERIKFMMTPISGDADLFSDRKNKFPNIHQHEKSSMNSGIDPDNITYIQGLDGEYLNSTYHLSVRGFTNATYRLLVSIWYKDENRTISLSQGKPQQDVISQEDEHYRLYQFKTSFTKQNAQPLRITLTPFTGSFDVYVANDILKVNFTQHLFSYEWEKLHDGNSRNNSMPLIITIKPDDQYYKPESTWAILVSAKEFVEGRATYSIIYTFESSQNYIMLQESVPFFDEIDKQVYKYYSFPVTTKHEDIQIILTALTGDPDLYINVGGYDRPTNENYDFKSSRFGSESISIQWEQKIKDKCPNPENSRNSSQCNINIAVHGYVASTFYIKVLVNQGFPSLLLEGLQQWGELDDGYYSFFYTIQSRSSSLQITLNPVAGDPDLYINIFNEDQNDDILEWKRPNKDKYDFTSRSSMNNEVIDISQSDMKSKCSQSHCVVLIGVYCYQSEYCEYSLYFGDENSAIELRENTQLEGNVSQGTFQYYTFYNARLDGQIQITLTPLSSGDPDIYVSKNKFPTLSDFIWHSSTWDIEHIYINNTDDYFKRYLNDTFSGIYTIGVYGWTDCIYYIQISTDTNLCQRLIDNQPFNGYLQSNDEARFYYYNSQIDDIKINLQILSGQGKFKVSKERAEATWEQQSPSRNGYAD